MVWEASPKQIAKLSADSLASSQVYKVASAEVSSPPSGVAASPPLAGAVEEQELEYHPRQETRRVIQVYVFFVLGQLFLNYDAGAIPSVLNVISEEFNLSETAIGVMGALPYVGLVISSPIVGFLLQRYSQKRVLLVTMCMNFFACALFTASVHVSLLFAGKLLMGLTQAGYFIYLPVWIDEFAPKKHLTLCMGFLQGSVVFGVMLGYLVTGFISPWQYSIIVEDVAIIALLLILLFTPAKYVDLYNPEPKLVLEIQNAAEGVGAEKKSKSPISSMSHQMQIKLGVIQEDEASTAKGRSRVLKKRKSTDDDSPAFLPYKKNMISHSLSRVSGLAQGILVPKTHTIEESEILQLIKTRDPRKLSNYHRLQIYKTSIGTGAHPAGVPGVFSSDELGAGMGIASVYSSPVIRRPLSAFDGTDRAGSGALGGSLEGPGVARAETYDINAMGSPVRNKAVRIEEQLPPSQTSRNSLGRILTRQRSRAGVIVVPSPCGAVLNSLDVVAGFDDPAVIVKHRPTSQYPGAFVVSPDVCGSPVSLEAGDELPTLPTVPPTYWFCLKLLLNNGVYLWTSLTLCALFFVVTALQYWATNYFIVAKHADPNFVRFVFSATAATAPALGVLVGAISIDCLGGYRSTRGMFIALLFCLGTGLSASACGVVASFLDPFAGIIAMIWFQMFFGGTILPPATGILIAAVNPEIRPFASSFSMFSYNILGYSLGTFLPGPFMTSFGVETGMKIIFFWSFFGVIFISMAIFHAWRNNLEMAELPPDVVASKVAAAVPEN